MTRYDAVDDPLCYPGTQVLRNKANLRDQETLDQFETLMYLTRAEEDLPTGQLDYAYYKAIHFHFFQDVYDWAGSPRRIRTAKGGSWFCLPEYIDAQMELIFAQLAAEKFLSDVGTVDKFAARAGYYVTQINAIHPFREGNGRCQLTFLSLLCDLAGHPLNEDLLDPAEVMQAMIVSFHGNIAPLVNLIRRVVVPRPLA